MKKNKVVCKTIICFITLDNNWAKIRFLLITDMGTSAVVRVIEQCCFNNVLDPFNGQTVHLISKPPKVIESRKANLKHYWNNTVLLL